MILLVVLALLVLAGLAAVTGHVADTRDPRFGVGPMIGSGRVRR